MKKRMHLQKVYHLNVNVPWNVSIIHHLNSNCKMIDKYDQNFLDIAAYRTVSIKRPDLIFFQKSLRYDRKKEGLNILSTRSYNRVVRVDYKEN